MRSFCVCILVLVGSVAGTMTISSDSTTSIAIGTQVKLSCQVTPLTNSITWFAAADTSGTELTTCLSARDMCMPVSNGNYTFSSDFSTGKYVLEIQSFSETDLVFTCSHATTPAETDTITLTVKESGTDGYSTGTCSITTTTTTTQESTTEPDAGSNTGLIVGVVCGLVFLVLVVVGVCFLNSRMKQNDGGDSAASSSAGDGSAGAAVVDVKTEDTRSKPPATNGGKESIRPQLLTPKDPNQRGLSANFDETEWF